MKLKSIIGAAIIAVALSFLCSEHRAATYTNTSYYFDDSTGNIITNLTINANPPLYGLTNGYFFDPVLGNYCVMVTTSLPTSYELCTNVPWGVGNIYTSRVCATLSSNITVTGRFKVGGAYPTTNKAAAVQSLP